MKKSELKTFIKETILNKIKETSTTAGISGFSTPKAFKGKRLPIVRRALTEASYRKFKTKVTQNSPNIRVRKALNEIQKCLNELDYMIEFNKKLREEVGSSRMSDNTNQIKNIYSKLLEINRKIKQIR